MTGNRLRVLLRLVAFVAFLVWAWFGYRAWTGPETWTAARVRTAAFVIMVAAGMVSTPSRRGNGEDETF